MNLMQTMQMRARENLDVHWYRYPTMPHAVDQLELTPPEERQYVLRMLVHRPDLGWSLPKNLLWLYPALRRAINYQEENFGDISNRFVYVTVRHGEVTSQNDDVWHADGFSLRTPHVPEQNYIWCNHSPTEFYNGPITVPDDFDGMKHNIHMLFQDLIPKNPEIYVAPENTLLVFDTYHIHRRPVVPVGTHRTMVRISFVPIQIETDDCQQNPAFPVEVFNRSDIRTRLERYPV